MAQNPYDSMTLRGLLAGSDDLYSPGERFTGRPVGEPIAEPQAPVAQRPDYTKLGPYAGKMRGFESSKFNNPYDQWSEKYKIGGVMSHFDPMKGVTPEMIEALNSLGIADFSGEGDKLSVRNSKNDPRFGQGGMSDVVFGLKGQNADTSWQPWFVDEGNGGSAGGGPMAASPLLADSGSNVGAYNSDFFQRLMQQLQQQIGPASYDRSALMSLLGGGQ